MRRQELLRVIVVRVEADRLQTHIATICSPRSLHRLA
jgi:hypothetical protein